MKTWESGDELTADDLNGAFAEIQNAASKQIATFAQLAGVDVTEYTQCFMQGYAAPGDRGHASWTYSAEVPHASANGVTIVASSVGPGCWIMLIPAVLSGKACGMVADGVTDDTAVLGIAALDGQVLITGTPYINGTLSGSFMMAPGAYFKLGPQGAIIFNGLKDTVSKVYDLSLGGSVDLSRLEFTRPEWGGALGTGNAHDDVNGFLWTVQSNTEMRLRRGVTYGVGSKMSFSNLQNFTLQAAGAEVLFTGPAPTAAGQASVFTFKSATTFGQCANIAVFDLQFDFLNAPSVVTQRVDNNFAIYFSLVDGITVERCKVLSSWSAAFWIVYSNNTCFRRNVVKARDGAAICADGITHQSCGYNIVLENNIVIGNGDDGIAVTWFTGNIPSTVGLMDNLLASRNVRISSNTVEGQKLSGRGIFLGGILGGEITNNTVRNTSAYGIMLSRNTVDQYLGALVPSFVIGNGGSGYAVNDLIEFGGGFSPMVAQVTAVTAGAVTGFVIQEPGVFGTVPTGAITPTSTSGSGLGLTATFTWLPNPFYNANGVNGGNRSLKISGNTLEGCALNSNDPNAGVGGLIVSESNFNITVEDNTFLTCNNVAILCSGNAHIRNNTFKGTTLQAKGTVTAAQMPYKGTAIVTVDFSASYSCYGNIEDNRMYYGAGRAIWVGQGSTLDPWVVKNNVSKNHGVPQTTSIDGKLALIAPFVNDTAYGSQWIHNTIRDTRNNTKMPIGLCVIASAAVKEVGTTLDCQTAAPGLAIPFDMATRLQLSASANGFAIGATVTGSVSGATALVAGYTPLADGTHDSIVVYQIVGTFTTSDTLLDSNAVAQSVTSVTGSQGNGFIFLQQPAIVVQPGTTPSQINISVLGAGYGKAYVVQQSPGGPAVSITADRNTGNNIRILISNPSAGVVTIPAGLWVIREV